jgi:metal-responsive CopG/Arc/MetJ family transcriptional regulator
MKLDHDKITKEKVTVTLSPKVLRAVDRWCKEMRIKSRSAALEQLVEKSIQEEERRHLEAATEAYYRSLSSGEREEDKSWAKSSSDQAMRRSAKE